MLENIEVLCHSSRRINREKIIYIDPFKISNNYNDADIILITHTHYDHYSKEDIEKVRKANTIIFAPEEVCNELEKMGFSVGLNLFEMSSEDNQIMYSQYKLKKEFTFIL